MIIIDYVTMEAFSKILIYFKNIRRAGEEETLKSKPKKKRKNVSLTVSEYGSGLEPTKKKKKKAAEN